MRVALAAALFAGEAMSLSFSARRFSSRRSGVEPALAVQMLVDRMFSSSRSWLMHDGGVAIFAPGAPPATRPFQVESWWVRRAAAARARRNRAAARAPASASRRRIPTSAGRGRRWRSPGPTGSRRRGTARGRRRSRSAGRRSPQVLGSRSRAPWSAGRARRRPRGWSRAASPGGRVLLVHRGDPRGLGHGEVAAAGVQFTQDQLEQGGLCRCRCGPTRPTLAPTGRLTLVSSKKRRP